MDSLKHLQRGDLPPNSAAFWNAAIDAARANRDERLNSRAAATRIPRNANVVAVRNDTADDLPRFAVVGLGEALVAPVDDSDRFLDAVMLSGVVPTAAHFGRFGVLLEPIAKDDFGRACVAGVFPARVKITDENHTAADVKPNYVDYLESAGAGAATLLWVEPEEEREPETIAWAIVRIGGAGGGAGGTYAMITSRSGTAPPYRYTAIQAEMDADGAWSEVAGGTEYANVFNSEEGGTGGEWVSPLNDGDPVEISPAPGGADAFVCKRSNYRGTY